MQETKETSLITKKDLRSVFWRSFTMQSSWSFDKMMAYGFMYSIEKPLRKIYPKDDDYFEALHRHTETFNITPHVSPFVIDLSVAMEQECAKADNFNKESINNLKVGLMGPLSGIGDSFFWGTFRVITAGIGIAFAQQGSILGALLYFFLYTAIHFLTKYITGNAGYKMGTRFLENSAENHLIEKMSYGASILGLTVIGAMIGTMVTLKTSLTFQFSGTETTLQSIFDQIFPGLLPLGAGPVAESVIRSRFGAPFRDDSLFFLGDDSEEAFRRFYRAVERHWAPLMRERAQTYPGVPEMLGELKEQGYVLAVCSNAKEEELEDVLGVLSIREYFDYIQGLTSRQDKADSLGVLIERAGADWCCMVGDRFYDREAAKANETAFIGCRYGYGGADEFGDGDLLAEDSVEIPGLLKRLVSSTPWLKPWQRP